MLGTPSSTTISELTAQPSIMSRRCNPVRVVNLLLLSSSESGHSVDGVPRNDPNSDSGFEDTHYLLCPIKKTIRTALRFPLKNTTGRAPESVEYQLSSRLRVGGTGGRYPSVVFVCTTRSLIVRSSQYMNCSLLESPGWSSVSRNLRRSISGPVSSNGLARALHVACS